MTDQVSEYRQWLKAGPFPGCIDPWAEVGHYFQQVHNRMIGEIVKQIADPLIDLGYLVGGEASLTIADRREPDIFVHRFRPDRETMPMDVYIAGAEALALDTGVQAIEDDYEVEALFIRELKSRKLVTVIEIISPSNKRENTTRYRTYRHDLVCSGVNFVEIDPTRSINRLLASQVTRDYAYHTAIYLPGEKPLIIGSDFEQPLKNFALPLRSEVLPVQPQQAWDTAYRDMTIAGQIENAGHYTPETLPFPSTLNQQQQQAALRQVQTWKVRLDELRAQRSHNN